MPSTTRIDIHRDNRAAPLNGDDGTALRPRRYYVAQSRVGSVNVTTNYVDAATCYHACKLISVPLAIKSVTPPPSGVEQSP
jgi:hypothetical protein